MSFKQGNIDAPRHGDWTLLSRAIGEHSTHLVKYVCVYVFLVNYLW